MVVGAAQHWLRSCTRGACVVQWEMDGIPAAGDKAKGEGSRTGAGERQRCHGSGLGDQGSPL